MQITKFALTATLVLSMTTLTRAAGLKAIEVPADSSGPALKALVWSPCAAPTGDVSLGPYTLPGVRDCPIAGDKLPLVIISHGRGGSRLGHHDTAETLADAGFVAVALDHPGDTRSDMSRTGDISVFVERPADIKRLIDFMLTASPDSAKIDPQRIGFFGFSRGGYTGLVVIGANPDFRGANVPCPDDRPPICDEIRRNELPAGELTHDPRVKAIAIADPLSIFLTADSLKAVKAPIQLWGSERGGDGVSPESVAALAGNLPLAPDFRVVPNAAHFAFLTPCPAGLSQSAPEICSDPPGFDRVAFHREFDASVLAFFRRHLAE